MTDTGPGISRAPFLFRISEFGFRIFEASLQRKGEEGREIRNPKFEIRNLIERHVKAVHRAPALASSIDD
jgi:hypothetical protein